LKEARGSEDADNRRRDDEKTEKPCAGSSPEAPRGLLWFALAGVLRFFNGPFNQDHISCSLGIFASSRVCRPLRRPWMREKIVGTKKSVAIVANNNPPITARPSGAFCSPPSPRPRLIGSMPMWCRCAISAKPFVPLPVSPRVPTTRLAHKRLVINGLKIPSIFRDPNETSNVQNFVPRVAKTNLFRSHTSMYWRH
jgi:hypothetical protein